MQVPAPHHASQLLVWSSIAFVAAFAIAGEVLIASAMRDIGDLDRYRTGPGLLGYVRPVRTVLTTPKFVLGSACMAFNFFAMLFALSLTDLSIAAPAITAFTYIGNAVAAHLVLGEHVDRRRWIAVAFVAVGVLLLSH